MSVAIALRATVGNLGWGRRRIFGDAFWHGCAIQRAVWTASPGAARIAGVETTRRGKRDFGFIDLPITVVVDAIPTLLLHLIR